MFALLQPELPRASGSGMALSKLDGSLFTKPRESLPLTTQAFTRGASGASAVDLFTPPAPSAKTPIAAVCFRVILPWKFNYLPLYEVG